MDTDPKTELIPWDRYDDTGRGRTTNVDEPAPFLPDPTQPDDEPFEEPLAEDFEPPVQANVSTPASVNDSEFVQDEEPFDRADAQKLGIIGGRGVGKTYLFQSMVYRTFSGPQSGALTYYLEKDAMHLYMAVRDGGEQFAQTGAAKALNRVTFIKKYQSWQRLPTTTFMIQQWYRLRLLYRTGYLGRRRSAIDVEFFDVSGERLGTQTYNRTDWEAWARAYGKAAVMVFCLPLWAAFPGRDLADEDWNLRELIITDFEQVIQNYREMRSRYQFTSPVRSILALTMSDDHRAGLTTLIERWISPYLEFPRTYLKQLQTGRGVARYLSNARKVSGAHARGIRSSWRSADFLDPADSGFRQRQTVARAVERDRRRPPRRSGSAVSAPG